MKKRTLAFLLAFVMILGCFAGLGAGVLDEDVTVYDASGKPADSVTLPKNEKTTLTADAQSSTAEYQWQIRVSDDVWANIVGSDGKTLELSYAMVASLLDGDTVDVRCRLTDGSDDAVYSNVVTVTVTAPTQTSSAPAKAAPAVKKSAVAAQSDPAETPSTFSIVINYIFTDGKQAAPSWTATIAAGSNYTQTVKSPTVVGYAPDQESVDVNIANASKDVTYNVYYYPAEVNYTVKRYQQNLDNDNYTLVDTETKTGTTDSAVGEGLAKKYEGFYSLLYDTTTEIAADGSTEVEIYYDRYYYLMSFDLDGGYGVEPIYARYGAPISVGEPTKAGYTFAGWDKTLPDTMPAENSSYKATWTAKTSGFTVVFWYENADDNGYSVAGTYKPADVASGTTVKSDDYKNQNFTGRDSSHFTYNSAKAETVTVSGDGSTVLNVYFTRKTYTLTFKNGQITMTCTKTEHEHSHSECCTKTGLHLSCNTKKCPVGYEHTHSSNCYKYSDLKITAKYGADIHNNFPINDSDGKTILWNVPDGCKSFKPDTYLASINTMPGEDITFTIYDQVSAATIWYYVEALNGETGTHSYNGKNFILYKSVKYTKNGVLTYAEEFHDIIGFKQWASDPKFSSFDQDGQTNTIKNNNYLYYTRNSYNLKFYNYNDYVNGKGGSVQFEAPLSSYYFVPDYPADLEPNAYVFAGWYTTAGCYDGSEADLDTMKMPASDVILYAKWTPKTHTVKTYLTKDAMDNGADPLHKWDAVPHGTAATPKADTPENGKYTFVGWFYLSDDPEPVEKAFDFSMPVNRDLNLYAKWISNTLVSYTIHYQLQDGTKIADDTIGSALAGATRTFDAKTGTQLNEGYQSGYFPETSSHSLTMDIEGGNEYTFIYVPKKEVNYTVRYLERGTNEVLHTEKHAATRDAVITEKFEQIAGYAPDAYQKRLVLSADEKDNVITFWYSKDDVHAPVQIIHWTQNIDGDGYTEYQSSTDLNGIIGQTMTVDPLDLTGFKYNADKSNASGTLTAEGLVLNLYYDRIDYPYEFRFLEQGTNKQLADPVKGTARYQAQVMEYAKIIPGYKLIGNTSKPIAIDIEVDNVAKKNVAIFYYEQETVDIKYKVVGPTGSGTLDNYQDNGIGVISADLKGSTPTAEDGFKFVGWFKDEACTQPVSSSWVGANSKLTPGKTKDYGDGVMGYEAATYYAKFEYDVSELTITKTGCMDIDENQSFIFHVTGEGKDMYVTVQGNDSVTIKNLKVGTYTVEEVTSWSWRYTPKAGTKTVEVKGGQKNEVTFENNRTNGSWLSGDNYAINRVGGVAKSGR